MESFNKTRWILCPFGNRPKPKISNISILPLVFELYESNIEPFIRFAHLRDISMAGWCKIKKEDYRNNEDVNSVSRCQLDVSCDWRKVNNLEINKMANIRLLSFDLECFSEIAFRTKKNSFPDYNNATDIITQIGSTVYDFNTKKKIKHIVTIVSPIDSECDPIDDIVIWKCKNEKELIIKWVEFVKIHRPRYTHGL